MGAALATPLIQGPTLWYQRKAAIDAYQQALANYRQTVLAALAQVADALDALQHDAQTLSAQSQALDAAAEALHLIQANYQAGTVNYLQVLIADYQYQQASTWLYPGDGTTSSRYRRAFRCSRRRLVEHTGRRSARFINPRSC